MKNYTVWLKNGGFYIVEAHALSGAESWAAENLVSSWAYCEETKGRDHDEYRCRGYKTCHAENRLGEEQPYKPSTAMRISGDFPENVHINSAVYGKSTIFAMIEGLIQAKQKIAAIKFVRQFTEWGLKESKEFIETHFQK